MIKSNPSPMLHPEESNRKPQPGPTLSPTESKHSTRKAFLLRVPAELIEELRCWSEEEYRSMNAQVEFVLREALARRS